jgi:hypothetical protein
MLPILDMCPRFVSALRRTRRPRPTRAHRCQICLSVRCSSAASGSSVRSSLPAAAGDEDTGKEKRSNCKNWNIATSSTTAKRAAGVPNRGAAQSDRSRPKQPRPLHAAPGWAVGVFRSRYSTTSVDASFDNYLERGCEAAPDWLVPSRLDHGYKRGEKV